MREERVCYVLSEAEQPVFTVEMTSFCMRCVAGRRGGFNHKLTYQAEPQIAQNMPLSCHYPPDMLGKMAQDSLRTFYFLTSQRRSSRGHPAQELDVSGKAHRIQGHWF